MKDQSRPDDLVFGAHAVEGLLAGGSRLVAEVLVETGHGRELMPLLEAAQARGIPIHTLTPEKARALAGGRAYQGIAVRVRPYVYANADELFDATQNDPCGLLLLLDSVQDPQNLGSILRTAAYFGVKGIILPKDRSVNVTPAVLRTSAGGAARVPVAQVTNLARTVSTLREQNVWVVGAAAHGTTGLRDLPTKGPLALVLGAEGTGLRRLVAASCDSLVTIPSPGRFESLNVGVAAGILLHAAWSRMSGGEL